jgi:hypothetical protein
MYSWGGGVGWGGGGIGQKFPNDEKNFRIFHGIRSQEGVCYPEKEAKTQFTNKNTHILRTYISQKHAVCRRKLFLIGSRKRGPKALRNL